MKEGAVINLSNHIVMRKMLLIGAADIAAAINGNDVFSLFKQYQQNRHRNLRNPNSNLFN